MNKKNFIKLARLIAKFAEVKTDKGVLIYDNELAVDVEVVTEEGEPAADGEYLVEDGRTIVVANGKVAEIKEAPVVEEPEVVEAEEVENPAENPASPLEPTDEKEAEYIAELEAKIQDLENTIVELEAKIKELEDKAEAPVEEPVALSAVAQIKSEKVNGALKYFK